MVMPISFLLQQRDQEEVPDEGPEDSQRRDDHAPEVEMERDPVPDISPPSPPLPASATAPADNPGPSYTAQHSPEYVHVSTRELAGVMDAICSLASTQASIDQRLTRAETTLEQCHTMLQQIMSHLGLVKPQIFGGLYFFFSSYKSSMYFSYTYPKYMKLYFSNIFLQNAAQGHNPTFFALTASMEHRLLVYLKGGSHNGVSKAQ